MKAAIDDYLNWMRHQNYAPTTVQARRRVLTYFREWLEARDIHRPFQVMSGVLEDYQAHLQQYRKLDRSQLSISSQRDRLGTVVCFFRWLHDHNRLRQNPASRLKLPRSGRLLPRTVLSVSEMQRVLAQPNVATPEGLRDRSLLELLYSTGIRRAEAGGLDIADMDEERQLIRIRQGKGRKDRVVPIGRTAIDWLRRYIVEVRPQFMGDAFTSVLFLRSNGTPLPLQRMTQLVHEYICAADLTGGKRGSCHVFRHTMATHMLDQGADVRYIQAMLGHAKLSTTQIYTHVSIRQLQEVHRRTHPGEAAQAAEPAELELEYMI